MRDMSKTGEAFLQGYLQHLSLFSLESFKSTNNTSIRNHACRLNYLWQRIYFESVALSINQDYQARLEQVVVQLIISFLDGNLEVRAAAGQRY